jgi:hypothetical protein
MTLRNISIGFLLAFGIWDAWLLAHPNLLGRMGVLLYDYWYIETFPKAAVTVLGTLFLTYFGSIFLQKKLPPKLSLVLISALLAVVLLLTIRTFLQFGQGSYAMTGKSFKLGAKLLPVVLMGILLQRWYEIFVQHFVQSRRRPSSQK